MATLQINGREIGPSKPCFFIADIAANHDGDLERALALIRLAHEAGADAAKFQHFQASKIVSDEGFKGLGGQVSHQATWSRSVVEVYSDASVPQDWTPLLAEECRKVGITFFSSPYDFQSVDHIDRWVPAFKIGSGDIDWLESLHYVAAKGKPVILATGAANMDDVEQAMETLLSVTDQVGLMQCNTNYTAAEENFDHLNLNVLRTYAARWPGVVLGLSDHTHGHAAVLGAVALGARMIERHFTDDNDRDGPDHRFALNPDSWAEMVTETRRLERALGDGQKVVEGNEQETRIIQRRCVRAAHHLSAGHVIERDDLSVLRPATPGAIPASEIDSVLGCRLSTDVSDGDDLRWEHLERQVGQE